MSIIWYFIDEDMIAFRSFLSCGQFMVNKGQFMDYMRKVTDVRSTLCAKS